MGTVPDHCFLFRILKSKSTQYFRAANGISEASLGSRATLVSGISSQGDGVPFYLHKGPEKGLMEGR
jgi:hypothetical protein